MMLFITALKEFKRHIFMNIVTLIELAVSIILVGVITTAVTIKYKYYGPFRDVYNSNGIYCRFIYAADDFGQPEQTLLYGEQLFPYLSSPEKIVCSNVIKSFPVKDGEFINANCYSFNDELIDRYTPQIGRGRWLKPKKDELEVVVTENNKYGWKKGGYVELDDGKGGTLKAKIVGELKDKQYIAGIPSDNDGNNDFSMFVSYIDSKDTDLPMLIFSSSQLRRYGFDGDACKCALIEYPDSVSGEQLDNDMQTLNLLGSLYTTELKNVRARSIDYFMLQLSNYLPLILVILIMTFISSISIAALSARQRLRDYAIYYICGSRWKSCVLVNLFFSLIISGLAAIGAAAIYHFIPKLPKSVFATLPMTIASDMWVAISVILLIAVYILVSAAMPLIIIGRNTPKEILTGGNNK